MSGPLDDLDGDLAELARVRIAIEAARAAHDVARLSELTARRAQLRELIGVAQAADLSLEVALLRRELAGLRQLVSEAPPDLGFAVACTSSVGGGGGSAAANFPYGKYNRAVNNDATGGYRSRNSALERINWLQGRLADIATRTHPDGANVG
jgi:hypothetical protein